MTSTVRLAALAVAALLPAVAAAQMPSPYPPPQPPQVVTQARGEVITAPDRATLMFQIETRGLTASAAGQENARRQRILLDTLRKIGIPAAQIATSGYNVQPERKYDRDGAPPRIVGYVARNTVRVEVRDIAQTGRIIDAALAKETSTIGGLNFFHSAADSLRREALTIAIKKACLDARAMAIAAGGQLSDLLEVNNASFDDPRPMMEMQMARRTSADASSETPIEPGERSLSANVVTRWRIVFDRAPGAADINRCQ